MRYHLITYGCQMNQADSEKIAASLEKKGYKKARLGRADLIVVNMCSVRQSAADRVFGLNQKLSKLKSQNSNLKIILTGCVLKKDREKFRKFFDEIKKMPQRNCPSALIPISHGCNNFCTYCVVPLARGKLVCLSHQIVLKEVKKAAEAGFKEIWLLGQNVNDYQSPADASINFAKLLKMANDIPGDFSIRFMSPHPRNFTDELISVMAESEKVAKYLNLPVQSGDSRILKKMRRPYTMKQYKDLVGKIRKKIPNINLSTDVIVGFPGETRNQFKNTTKLFKEIKFDIAYVAKYSPRPGTAAFRLKDNVAPDEKKRREKILRKLTKHPS
ncbi:MAG: hypothetical protein A2896_02520 [Candidatus Nealsonbacteria bacterium RIFCSPLOWO2_01_FULL_43_32]|uniref:tRNA-2-methylthio-N(6)-dimethylallyladenosine synthase n=1 Tax=Candidatus Nealsonbacteria bacterium RIFCSPLOWO2_01_FULL_43_32 TaxID=1801672 RepID=A0A1G2EG05_9BACT|nr:MAG: hypothetical protein A2896_02520 [Candidatus Nealsonbacteria bacterium RIFCSPLOWO2_01_FULL_43_32]